MNSPEDPDLFPLPLEDVRLMVHALSFLRRGKMGFSEKLAIRDARVNLARQTVAQHNQNYPSLDPEKNKYNLRLSEDRRAIIGLALDAVAELVPIHHYGDSAESTFRIDFTPARPSAQTGTEQNIFMGYCESDDMLGDIERLQEQLGLIESSEP